MEIIQGFFMGEYLDKKITAFSYSHTQDQAHSYSLRFKTYQSGYFR